MTIFSDKAASVADIKSNRLVIAGETYFPGAALDDDYVYEKLLSAEADAIRKLRVFLEPTVVIPDDAEQSEIDALVAASTKYAQEPAYDYEPEFFRGERWGYIVAQHNPIISVQSIQFSYPSPSNTIYTIPNEWIRLDKRSGHIRLVPATQAFAAPLSAFLMQALGAGSTIPFMIRVRYTSGLVDVNRDWPDLVDVIKKMATLRIIADTYHPQSGSISGDGLSQSVSVDFAKFGEELDAKLSTIRQAIHGVMMMVL